MAPRFKGLSQAEIEKYMNECDTENFSDSDSDCDNLEESIDYYSLDESVNENFLEKPKEKENFVWKQADEDDKVNILKFIGNPGIKISISGFENAYDYFKILFSNEILEIKSKETNRYADRYSI